MFHAAELSGQHEENQDHHDPHRPVESCSDPSHSEPAWRLESSYRFHEGRYRTTTFVLKSTFVTFAWLHACSTGSRYLYCMSFSPRMIALNSGFFFCIAESTPTSDGVDFDARLSDSTSWQWLPIHQRCDKRLIASP